MTGGDVGGAGGEDSASVSEESEEEGVQEQALPVALLYDEAEIAKRIAAGPPATAEEYLLRVRYEARQLPVVMTAPDAAPGSQDDIAAITRHLGQAFSPPGRQEPAPATAQATGPVDHGLAEDMREQWARRTLADFEKLRSNIAAWTKAMGGRRAVAARAPRRLPSAKDAASWRGVVFGPSAAGSSAAADSATAACRPLVSLLAQLDDVATLRVFDMLAGWAVGRPDSDSEADDAASDRDGAARGGRRISAPLAAWLYGVMTRVDQPAPPDTTSTMRDLFRACARQRRSSPGGAPPDHCSVLMLLVATFFGQRDLEGAVC